MFKLFKKKKKQKHTHSRAKLAYDPLEEASDSPIDTTPIGAQPDIETEINIRRLSNGYIMDKNGRDNVTGKHNSSQFLFTNEKKLIKHVTNHIKELEEDIKIKKLGE